MYSRHRRRNNLKSGRAKQTDSFDISWGKPRFLRWEMTIFDPPQNLHPLADHQKIVTGHYVGDPYGAVPNLVPIRL